jgi:hypothetical protein
LIEQPPGRCSQSAVGPFLNPMCDAPPEQIRAERFWRIGPK